MKNLNLKKLVNRSAILVWLIIFCSIQAYASTTGNLPFNTQIDNFKDNFMAWIFVALVLIWVATCFVLAFGEWGDGMKRLMNIIFWASLALAGPAGAAAIFGQGAVF